MFRVVTYTLIVLIIFEKIEKVVEAFILCSVEGHPTWNCSKLSTLNFIVPMIKPSKRKVHLVGIGNNF